MLDTVFVAYGALILLALLPICAGCRLALAADEGGEGAERLSSSDAYWFPVLGSATLFSFYCAFKWFPKEYVNRLLTAYFALFGAASLSQLCVRAGRLLVGRDAERRHHLHLAVSRAGPAGTVPVASADVTWLNVLAAAGCGLFSAYYVWSKHWVASNVFGLSFATTAISLIHLDGFPTGIILLAGLFLYDIFWVFGTDVMVSVAKNFDVPVKLLFPKDLAAGGAFTMLGLGDIVLPGVYLALCRKFDAHRGTTAYFRTGLAAYTAGLLATMAVMHTFKAAQPALLYLSPACILSSLAVALCRGELGPMLAFQSPAAGGAPRPESGAKRRKGVKAE